VCCDARHSRPAASEARLHLHVTRPGARPLGGPACVAERRLRVPISSPVPASVVHSLRTCVEWCVCVGVCVWSAPWPQGPWPATSLLHIHRQRHSAGALDPLHGAACLTERRLHCVGPSARAGVCRAPSRRVCLVSDCLCGGAGSLCCDARLLRPAASEARLHLHVTRPGARPLGGPACVAERRLRVPISSPVPASVAHCVRTCVEWCV
jgi:hypothetical protein